MPINSINDIDNMIAAYKRSEAAANTPRSYSDPATGYWQTNSSSYYRSISDSSSSSSPAESSPSFLSRVMRVFSPRDIVDEHGNFNSSRQLIK
jgi:hypothetical protein